VLCFEHILLYSTVSFHAKLHSLYVYASGYFEGPIHRLERFARRPRERVIIEHPSGVMPAKIEVSGEGDEFFVKKAGAVRTARKIMDGFVYY
jgi:2-methylaconitate cis-trans-isomerase PrpF